MVINSAVHPQSQVIAKSYLTGLVVKCGLIFAAGLLLTSAILYYSALQPLGPSYQESFARLAQLKHEMLIKSIITYCLLMVLTIGGIMFTAIIYSHRVIGPMVGIKRTIGQISSGNLRQEAVMRRKDAIKPMADALNSMVNSYSARISHIRQLQEELQAALELPDAAQRSRELTDKIE